MFNRSTMEKVKSLYLRARLRYESFTHTSKEPSSPIFKGQKSPLLTQSHQLPTVAASYWLNTNHCCPILTQYTASSPRNAQLSQMDLVNHSIHHSTYRHLFWPQTLPKAQRTRGLSSYYKFLKKSWSNFTFRYRTGINFKISTKHEYLG